MRCTSRWDRICWRGGSGRRSGESIRGRSNGLDASWRSLNDPKNYWAIISTLELILLFERTIKHLNYCFKSPHSSIKTACNSTMSEQTCLLPFLSLQLEKSWRKQQDPDLVVASSILGAQDFRFLGWGGWQFRIFQSSLTFAGILTCPRVSPYLLGFRDTVKPKPFRHELFLTLIQVV